MAHVSQASDPTVAVAAQRMAAPWRVPNGWSVVERRADGAAFRRQRDDAVVIASVARYADSKRWVHLSMSHRRRLPTWRELVAVRDAFLGPQAKCIQIVAAASEHVNIHEFCLHLWHCLDGDGLPDFTGGRGTI